MINKKFFFFFILFIASFKNSKVIAAEQGMNPAKVNYANTFEHTNPKQYAPTHSHQTLKNGDADAIWNLLSPEDKKSLISATTTQFEKENQEERKKHYQTLSVQTKELVQNDCLTEEHIASFILANYTYNQNSNELGLNFDDFCNKLSVEIRRCEHRQEALQGTGALTQKFNNAKDKVQNILKTNAENSRLNEEISASFVKKTKKCLDLIEKNKKNDALSLEKIIAVSMEKSIPAMTLPLITQEAGEILGLEAHYALFGTEKLKKNNAVMKKKLLTLPEKQKKHQEETILAYLDSNQSYFDKDLNKKLTPEELLKATQKFSQSLSSKENI